MSWRCISSAVTGASHKKKSISLQDAVFSYRDRDILYIAIADGHGSELCFRSHIGSEFAVRSAIDVARHQARTINKQLELYARKSSTLNVAKAILAYWAKSCLEHLKSQPFMNDELDNLSREKKRRLSGNALLAYGTTLAVLVCAKDRVFGFNIGDGDLLVLKGQKAESVFTKNKNIVGNETYSICTPDALKNSEYIEFDTKDINSMLLSTDGYRNSFAIDRDFEKVLEDLHKIFIDKGIFELSENFDTWLDETSEGGSGDDISAAFIYTDK